MAGLNGPFARIPHVLDAGDMEYLKAACRRHVSTEGIPCYALLEHLDSPTRAKIKQTLERHIGEPVYYLNDFYMYTDRTFRTDWHMDTELFTFERAINAWILLSPDRVSDPLGFIDGINDSPERRFHSMHIDGDECTFADYHTTETAVLSLAEIEAEQVHTPEIDIGDILLLDPMRFHKTNTRSPKHSIAIKFIMKGSNGFRATEQIDPCLWPEVALFNGLLRDVGPWEDFIEGVRRMLRTERGRKELSAGFYPEKFDLYRRNVMSL